MSEPSKDIPASLLWQKLSSAERPTKLVDFPRRGVDGEPVGQILFRVLTQEEQMAASASAEKFARDILKDSKQEEFGYARLYDDAVSVEMLFRACRDPDDPKRTVFPGPKALRQALTTDECAMLMKHYLTVQLEFGPTVISMSDEELEAWIDRLVEGGSAYPLDLCSSDLQQILVLHMAFQLRPSQMAKLSAGSPPDSDLGNASESGSSLDLSPES